MNLLLDTHVLLWWLSDDPRLGKHAVAAIANPDNRVFVSAASVWEIGIKQRLGKLKVPGTTVDVIAQEGFDELVITGAHAQEAAALPAHHRDPFDRMLVAQARLHQLVLVTADARVRAYDVDIMAH